MGGGIAMSFADFGYDVKIMDATQDALDRGMERIRNNYATSVKRGSLADRPFPPDGSYRHFGTGPRTVAPVRLAVCEHHAQRRRCVCGHVTSAAFPAG